MTKNKILTICFCYILFCFISVIYLFHLHINTSLSMPTGIYRAVSQPIIKNSLVAVCLPQASAQFGKQRGYLGSGECIENTEPVLKQVVAVGGDEVQVTAQGIWINNHLLPHSKVLTQDEQGRPLASQVFNIRKKLTANQFWLYGTASPKSWDSRYYGPIEYAAVRTVMVPVWIWSKN